VKFTNLGEARYKLYDANGELLQEKVKPSTGLGASLNGRSSTPIAAET
jgi:hypothetical protein